MSESRTLKGLKNGKISLLFYVLILLLNFFSRKIFIEYLGAEILGLNTTAMNLLGFLNLAELGIGTAISFSLYGPIYKNDKKTINEIISLQGYYYKNIGFVIISASALLMLFFPIIFNNIKEIPIIYTYLTFSAFLVDSVLGYFFNYKQVYYNASQQTYKITIINQSSKIVTIILQLLAIKYLEKGYNWWIILEVLGAFAKTYIFSYSFKKDVPFLTTNYVKGKSVRSKYPEIIIKIKQLFVHKIAGFVLFQTSPLIVFAFSSLSQVAIYGNYTLIINGMRQISFSVFNGLTAGIGNLYKEGNIVKVYNFFNEFFVAIFFLSGICCFAVYTFINDFITLWIGQEYLLDKLSLFLLVLIMFFNMIRISYEVFTDAAGLFSDVWATLLETFINLFGATVGGYYFGLPGIFSGILLSLVFKFLLWKPFYLFRESFKINVIQHFKIYLIVVLDFFIAYYVINWFPFKITPLSYIYFFIFAFCKTTLFGLIFLFLLRLSNPSTKYLIRRIINIVKK